MATKAAGIRSPTPPPRHTRDASRLLAIAAMLLALVGCTTPPPPIPPEPTTTAPPQIAREQPPAYHLRLRPSLDPTPRLAVEIVAHGLPDREWSVAALVSADLRDLKISDARGAVPFTQRRDGLALYITLSRAASGPLELSYMLVPAVTARPDDVPAALTLRIDNSHLLVSGETSLMLPTTTHPDPLALRLELVPHGPLVRLASSLGAEPGTPTRARLGDLRHAVFLAGTTGHALLRGPAGDDDFAWTGDPSFDLRWSAAETAGTRTAVDLYFGATPEEVVRFTALFAVDFDLPVGAQVLPRGPGLYVALAPGVRWAGPTRLAVAQGLVHRWIGGRLRLGEPTDIPAAGAWFADGYARFVAREVLFDLGTLSSDEYADELNAHHAELATSPLRHATLTDLATAAAQGDPDAHALMTARGVLHATRIDAQIRARHRGARSLRTLLRALVDEARAHNLATLPLSAFTDRLRDELGAAEVAVFTDAVLGRGALTLPAGALGPCFARGTRVYTRFELGFDELASRAETPGHVRGLRAGGPAARAGVREGERLLALTHTPGDPRSPALLTLERDGREVTVSYRPAGTTARGPSWSRRPGIDDARCLR